MRLVWNPSRRRAMDLKLCDERLTFSPSDMITEQQMLQFAPLISATAFVFSAIMVTLQLRNVLHDRFVVITNALFQTWQDPDFMKAQLWIIREMNEQSWQEFQNHHGNKEGEAAFLRVTGFYNRVGTLIHLSLVDGRSILRRIGGTACAVWQKLSRSSKARGGRTRRSCLTSSGCCRTARRAPATWNETTIYSGETVEAASRSS